MTSLTELTLFSFVTHSNITVLYALHTSVLLACLWLAWHTGHAQIRIDHGNWAIVNFMATEPSSIFIMDSRSTWEYIRESITIAWAWIPSIATLIDLLGLDEDLSIMHAIFPFGNFHQSIASISSVRWTTLVYRSLIALFCQMSLRHSSPRMWPFSRSFSIACVRYHVHFVLSQFVHWSFASCAGSSHDCVCCIC